MRRPDTSPLLLLVASIGVAAGLSPVACATTGGIESIVGAGGAGGTGTGFSTVGTTIAAGTGMPTRTCGVGSANPACQSCLLVACCAEANLCAGDGPCVDCIGAPTPAASCTSDGTYNALIMCLEENCADRCGLPSLGNGGAGGSSGNGPSSSGGNPSGGGGFATVGSSGDGPSGAGGFATVGSSGDGPSGAGGFATVGSSGGPSGNGGGGGADGAGGGSTGGSYTCAGVDYGVGCCDPSGNLFFCDVHGVVYEGICEGGSVCGWSADEGFYDCVAPPGGADPSGTYPLACMGP
jgi:hypothetical protein